MPSSAPTTVLRRPSLPVTEPIVPLPSESFVWRCDDYPLSWTVWNTHKECEIHLIRNAEGTCYVGDHIGYFSPGDLFLVGAELPHNWMTPLPEGQVILNRDVVLQFDEDRLKSASSAIPEMAQLDRLLMLARRGMVFHGAARSGGAAMLEGVGQCSGLQRFAKLLELLHLLARTKEYTLLSSAGFSPKLDDRSSGILAEVFRYLSGNLGQELRLSVVADLAGMTESSFSRFFKDKTGNTFTRHLTALRTGKACELLARTNLPITEICGEVGYENLSNFNRAFREVRGMTPSQYRKLARA
ncbi:AraC family transcriptional regulator [Tabrizicola sp. SY72]|nr:AraC family transcriptional regulator [Tabrizicola sp. SY72]